MTVYVDDMRAPYGRMIMCHMIADSEAELHAMADRIGIARKWFQAGPAHYDICVVKRNLAVKLGAVEITWKQAGCMVANRKATGQLGTPETAIAATVARLAARSSIAAARSPAATDAREKESLNAEVSASPRGTYSRPAGASAAGRPGAGEAGR